MEDFMFFPGDYYIEPSGEKIIFLRKSGELVSRRTLEVHTMSGGMSYCIEDTVLYWIRNGEIKKTASCPAPSRSFKVDKEIDSTTFAKVEKLIGLYFLVPEPYKEKTYNEIMALLLK